MEENKSKGKEERVKGSKPKPDNNLPRQYSNPKANLATTTPNEDMVEKYLQQAFGMENGDPKEVFTTANCVQTVDVFLSSERVTNCMNSLVIEEYEELVILDDGADTNVVGQGWKVVATHPFRKAHVVVFGHKVAVKRNLDIVTACTVVEVNGNSILLQISEAVWNPTSEHSLLPEYQLRDFGIQVNSIARRHG